MRLLWPDGIVAAPLASWGGAANGGCSPDAAGGWARLPSQSSISFVHISAIMIDQFGNVIAVIGIHDQGTQWQLVLKADLWISPVEQQQATLCCPSTDGANDSNAGLPAVRG